MTVVVLSGGGLFVHSPVALDESTRREVDELGEVSCIVAPNKLHNQFIGPWAAAYPSARVFAAPGLPERRRDLCFHRVLGGEPEPEWRGDLEQVLTAGNAFFSEVLFFRPAARTLIVADLIENLGEDSTSRIGCALMRLMGGFGRPVASPEFRFYTTDADQLESSLAELWRWDFDRIVLSHGDPIEGNGRAVFEQVIEELLRSVRRRSLLGKRIWSLLSRLQ